LRWDPNFINIVQMTNPVNGSEDKRERETERDRQERDRERDRQERDRDRQTRERQR
jgi:hypothetical protein